MIIILTELQVKSSKPKNKPYMLRDDRGLYLRIDPSGRKYWILRYWEAKKERQLSLGPYPDVGLKDARLQRDEIQAARARGESPRMRKPQGPALLFGDVVTDWLDVQMSGYSTGYLKCVNLRLAKYILPVLKHYRITDITSADILQLCRRIEEEGKVETAKRVKVLIGQVFRYAIATGAATTDPTVAIARALRPKPDQHFPTITDPAEIGLLMRAMSAYPYPLLRLAMLFSVLTFARPGEVRAAEWTEIKDGLWDIPASKMKMKRRHLIPLSIQSRDVLSQLRELTGTGRYLFPSARSATRPMSENAVRVALRSIGYTKEQIVPHGFRAMASTILHENGFPPLVIERQLAHVQSNTVARAYNHAEYLDERKALMQWWADFLWRVRDEA